MFAARNAMMTAPSGAAGGNSVAFDGTNSYLSINSTSAFGFGTGDYTVEAWVKGATLGKSVISSSSGCFGLRIYSSGLQIQRSLVQNFNFCTYSFSTNTWYHIAVARASGTLKFYINGVQYDPDLTGNQGYNWTNETSSYIGSNNGISEFISGNISNVRVVKGTAVYTSSFTVPTAPLTAVSGTTLLTAQAPIPIKDSSSNAYTVTANGAAAASALTPFA